MLASFVNPIFELFATHGSYGKKSGGMITTLKIVFLAPSKRQLLVLVQCIIHQSYMLMISSCTKFVNENNCQAQVPAPAKLC